jgi:hypothetical protein
MEVAETQSRVEYISSRYPIYKKDATCSEYLKDGRSFLTNFDAQAFSDWFRYFWLAKENIIPWPEDSLNKIRGELIELSNDFISQSMPDIADFIKTNL